MDRQNGAGGEKKGKEVEVKTRETGRGGRRREIRGRGGRRKKIKGGGGEEKGNRRDLKEEHTRKERRRRIGGVGGVSSLVKTFPVCWLAA